jgi:tRNA-2-methylthio-N6-dimethylallyladenosine synthase
MNMFDSEVAGGILAHKGFELLPEGKYEEGAADVVLMNTCSVREHAEDRVYGRLGMLAKAKRTRPELIVGLMGCMVEEHREALFRRYPVIDLMVGTRNIRDLPELIEEVRRGRRQVARIKHEGLSIDYAPEIKRRGRYHAWLPIMTGCNKVCTFCIVPITRGAEVSMPAREVYREASRLVGEGVRWITLLGQNVNSYRASEEASSDSDFPALLDMLCEIEGLEALTFTTSHPHDATEALYRVIAKNPKILRRFHLPLQSGSDRMLKRMKRLHTYAEYRAKIDRMRELIPDIAVTTDIISGFSGETAEDHAATRRALEEIRYDGAFIYKYSVRPGTPAARLEDDVPAAVKDARNAELLAVQRVIERDKNAAWIGRTVRAFAEDFSRKHKSELLGRTFDDRKVVFRAGPEMLGQTLVVRLEELAGETYRGTLAAAL